MGRNNWEDKKEEIILFIGKNQPSFYWHYDSKLSKEQIALIIASEDGLNTVSDELYESNLDYYCSLEDETIKSIIAEFGFDEDELEDDEEFKDFCREHICVDMDIDQLLSNTGDIILFYETGIETNGYGQTLTDYKNEVKQIKKFLKIKLSDKTDDKAILSMIYDASYGGQFVIYFTIGIKEFIENKKNCIKFGKNVHIAIIDTSGGSGGDCFVKGVEFTVPFDREKITYENSIKYNYSFAVCGMTSDWCDDTQYEFIDKKTKILPTEKSKIKIIAERDAAYDKVFKSGKCSFGDMDMNRHRNVTYINDYPCGNKCKDCGTFWID